MRGGGIWEARLQIGQTLSVSREILRKYANMVIACLEILLRYLASHLKALQ